jgi:uncharacterized protein (UPF0210 family)
MSTQRTPVSKSLVRAITGFVRFNGDLSFIEEAARILGKAKTAYESAGYDVNTLRVVTNPLPEVVGGMSQDDALALLKTLDDLAAKGKFTINVGPATNTKLDNTQTMQVAALALSTLRNIETSAIIADSNGIYWNDIRLTAELVQYVSEHSPHGLGNLRFAALAMVNQYSPFFPDSFFTEEGQQFVVGLECADAVHDTLVNNKGKYASALAELTSGLKQQIASAIPPLAPIQQQTGWNTGIELIASRLGEASVAGAIEAYTGEKFGAGGTLTAIRLIAEAMQAAESSGNSAPALPVIEDQLLAKRWTENTYRLDSLLAYAAAGSMGVDAIPLPGQIHPGQLKRILSDVALLASKSNTPISARLLPVPGKKGGVSTSFEDPSLVNTTIHPLP